MLQYITVCVTAMTCQWAVPQCKLSDQHAGTQATTAWAKLHGMLLQQQAVFVMNAVWCITTVWTNEFSADIDCNAATCMLDLCTGEIDVTVKALAHFCLGYPHISVWYT